VLRDVQCFQSHIIFLSLSLSLSLYSTSTICIIYTRYKNHRRGCITAVRIAFFSVCVNRHHCSSGDSPRDFRPPSPIGSACEKPQTPNSYVPRDANRCPERLQRRRRRRLKFPSPPPSFREFPSAAQRVVFVGKQYDTYSYFIVNIIIM